MAAKQGKGIRRRCMSCWRKQHPEPRAEAAPSASPNHEDNLLSLKIFTNLLFLTVLIGVSVRHRTLFIVYEERKTNIRLISARKASSVQRRKYEEGSDAT
ncbi:MAG: hypothetical protein CV088_19460 [Nitrospira sp. LK70]|nr:hypothetical protein [Nitrospira sp. LK70]